MSEDLERISSKMSYILRYNPGTLEMDDFGVVSVSQLADELGVTSETIRQIVSDDPKGRYVISGQGIRAVQGHSIPVSLVADVLENPTVLFHGTKTDNLGSIYREGIKRGSRQHVHLSKEIEVAWGVANRRKGQSVVLTVDAGQMAKDGLTLSVVENDVVLVDHIPPEYILEASYGDDSGSWTG